VPTSGDIQNNEVAAQERLPASAEHGIRVQFRRDGPALLAFYIPLLLVFLGVVAFGWYRGVPPTYLFRDPAATMDEPFYIGFLSNVGVLGWCIGATASLFAWAVLRRSAGSAELRRFFLFGGIFTAIMCLDDMFLLHEEVFPKRLFHEKGLVPVHLSEKVVYAIYALFGGAFLVTCRAAIRKSGSLVLFVAMFFLGLSVVSELVLKKRIVDSVQVRQLVEDGAKFLGIVGWGFYFVVAAYRALVSDREGRQIPCGEPSPSE
jgi:hypothetical protein